MKTEIYIDVGVLGNRYNVYFHDENGTSILAKTKNLKYAEKLKKRFEGYLEEGRLLPTYKSVYNS